MLSSDTAIPFLRGSWGKPSLAYFKVRALEKMVGSFENYLGDDNIGILQVLHLHLHTGCLKTPQYDFLKVATSWPGGSLVRSHDGLQAPDAEAPAQPCLLLSRYVLLTFFSPRLPFVSFLFQKPHTAKKRMVILMCRRAESGLARPDSRSEQDQHQTDASAASVHQLYGGAHATHF